MSFRIAVDIGGTFTDGVAYSDGDRRIWVAKSLTTPSDPGDAVETVVRDLIWQLGGAAMAADVSEAVHATTLVTNTVIERRGARAAMIMTAGTADTLQLRREDRYDLFDLDITFPEPLVPRDRIFEVSARVDAKGEEVHPLEEADIDRLLFDLRETEPEAVAICLLHSYANGRHERALADRLHRALPDVAVSLSCEVSPEIREYERASTTAANAFVQPLTGTYLEGLKRRLSSLGLTGPLRIMTSSGGFTSNGFAARHPVKLLESGPAAGVISAVSTGKRARVDHVLAFDMGGTTAKACVAAKGTPELTNLFEAGREKRFAKGSGLPIVTTSIDLIEIGAGGGSIARASTLGLLNVGPESAGSVPGPACYGGGGGLPTVTDADLLLGYLDAEAFLGGRMVLDRHAARQAVRGLAADLKTGEDETAFGIFNLVNETMAAAARVHIAEKGYDPRVFTLVATGGAGPVHAVEVAKKLGIGRVICSVAVGVGSCLGLLAAPPRVDKAWTKVEPISEVDWQEAECELARVRLEAADELAQSGTDSGQVVWSLTADMRYRGQGTTIPVTIPYDGSALASAMAPTVQTRFQEVYARLYGSTLAGTPEVVTWRLIGSAARPPPEFKMMNTTQVGEAEAKSRLVYLPDDRRFGEVPVYDRYDLSAGAELMGPAILQESESTIVVARPARISIIEDLSVSISLANGGCE